MRPSLRRPLPAVLNSSLPVIEINVWVSPDSEGAFGASLTVEFPPNVLVISVTTNPLVCSITGDLFDGTSFLLTECQPASFWSHRLYCMIIDSSQGFIYLNPHPADGLTVRRCDTGLPVASLGTGIWLGLNHSYGTEETSWGAIKSMYGD